MEGQYHVVLKRVPYPVGPIKCLSLCLWPISLSLIHTKLIFLSMFWTPTFSFDERLVMNCVNNLCETRYSNYVGICPKTAPSNGYYISKYINWTGIPGSICIKNKYDQHLHSYLSELSSTTSRGSEWGLGKLKLIVFTFTTLTETNGIVLFVLEITIATLWKMKSTCCFTARNMTFVARNILNCFWVLT